MLEKSKILHSLDLIAQSFDLDYLGVFLGHSGGKDSCVLYHLAMQLCPGIAVVHNPKPSTHPDTVRFLYRLAQRQKIYMVPSQDMPDFIRKNKLAVELDGSRRNEAGRTDGRSTVIEQGGVEMSRTEMPEIVRYGLFGIAFVYPIAAWTDTDVWEYIASEKIAVSDEYKVGIKWQTGM